MQNAVVNVNGQILKNPLDPVVSAFDRSFMYGDSLYEVARTYEGKFFFLEEHLIRMGKSAELCAMKLSQPLSLYREECEKTLKAFQAQPGMKDVDAYCRIIVSRGTGKIGFGTENLITKTQYFVICQPLATPTEELFEKGYHYSVVERYRNDRKALDPAMKSGNYLNSLLAYLEATKEGSDDALLCDSQGFLTEGTTFNIFYARRGIIATPPLDVGILDGLTRRKIIQIARDLGYEVRECRFPKERLYEADEVFMTSTIKEAFPVTQIDGKKIADGRPGRITRELRQAFHTEALKIVRGQVRTPIETPASAQVRAG